MTSRPLLPAVLLFFPALAWAHHFMENALPRTFMEGLLSGLGHPIVGLDHAAFIVAAGFVLALVPRGLWGVLALIAGALAGTALHLSGFGLPASEVAVAVSVVLIGGLLIARRPLPLGWLAAGLAVAGVLHGHAYAESIFGAEPAPLAAYLIGFSLIQLVIASAAYALHKWLLRRPAAPALAPVLGAAVGAIGVVFLVI